MLTAIRRQFQINNLAIGVAIAAIALSVIIHALRIDYDIHLRYRDGWWYLNRAWLHSHGVFDEVSFYVLAYPLLIGMINHLVNDLPLSGIIVNLICEFFLCLGIYVLGTQLASRLAGAISVFAFVFSRGNLTTLHTLHANWLFVPVSIWLVIFAIQLVRRPNRKWAIGVSVLLSVAPFIRSEGLFWSVVVIAALAVMRFQGHTWQTLGKYFLIIALVVIPGWLAYLWWFSLGVDAPGDASGPFQLVRFVVAFRSLTAMVDGIYWITLLGGAFVFLLSISSITIHSGDVLLCFNIKPVINLITLFILTVFTFLYNAMLYPIVNGYSDAYSLQMVPYIMIACGIVLAKMSKHFLTRAVIAAALFMIVYHSYLLTEQLPLPLEYHDRAASVRQVVSDLVEWKQANGHSDAVLYTLCTDLMIFAEFDIRLPYTGLLFSSRRFAPPEQVLPQIAAQDDLLIVCPFFITDLYFHPYNTSWTRLYQYWGGIGRDNPELADMARYPLEEVGRVREYIIYRVKPELQSAQ